VLKRPEVDGGLKSALSSVG